MSMLNTRSLEVEKLSHCFVRKGAEQPSVVLENISFNVESSEFFTVVGPSGCGKTTLLNLIAAFIPIQEGSIKIDGMDVKKPNNKCVIIPQELSLFEWKTVIGNVEFGLKAKGLPLNDRRSTAIHYLQLVDLQGCMTLYPHQISGGMKQRLALARALAIEPSLVLMDEPFASLDWQAKREMHDKLLQVCRVKRQTIVMVTHDIDEAIYLSDKIMLLSSSPASKIEILSVPAKLKESIQDSNSLNFLDFRNYILTSVRHKKRLQR